jgi:hypothetical protein
MSRGGDFFCRCLHTGCRDATVMAGDHPLDLLIKMERKWPAFLLHLFVGLQLNEHRTFNVAGARDALAFSHLIQALKLLAA